MDLDDGRNNTHPTSSREKKGQYPDIKASRAAANANTHIEKSLYCKSLMLWPSRRYERDRVNEITAWMKTLVYT